MCVVAPGKQPVTESEKVLSTSSGQIIHLHLLFVLSLHGMGLTTIHQLI